MRGKHEDSPGGGANWECPKTDQYREFVMHSSGWLEPKKAVIAQSWLILWHGM